VGRGNSKIEFACSCYKFDKFILKLHVHNVPDL